MRAVALATVMQQLAAASPAEVWGLTSGLELRALDLAAGAWIEAAIDPAPEAPQHLAANPNADLWIVTGSGRIYRYLP